MTTSQKALENLTVIIDESDADKVKILNFFEEIADVKYRIGKTIFKDFHILLVNYNSLKQEIKKGFQIDVISRWKQFIDDNDSEDFPETSEISEAEVEDKPSEIVEEAAKGKIVQQAEKVVTRKANNQDMFDRVLEFIAAIIRLIKT